MRAFRRFAVAVASAALLAMPAVAPSAAADDRDPKQPILNRGDRYVPKAPGTVENLTFWFGPYTVPPGHDSNRVDLELPVLNGFIEAIEPSMVRANDGREPSHQEAHIHHAHWFALDPGNEEDNYTGGNTEWIFGNGDEETRADFQERSAADPFGPIYGQYIGAAAPQTMIYMLHNKTSQPLVTYIVLDVTFEHGTKEQLNAMGGRPHHDVAGVLFGRTYSVPREPDGDGIFETTKDQPRAIEWTSTLEGTIIGTGGHLHPGGLRVVVENMGSKDNPCPDDGRGYGGTLLLNSEALFRNALFSEDFQMEVSHPAWRAPVHKGDRIRITGVYENKDHGWYDVMTHEGLYVDTAQPPRGRCKPELIGAGGSGFGPRATRHIHRHRHVHRRHVHRGANGKRRIHRHRWVHIHRRVHLHPRATTVHRHKHIHRRNHVHRGADGRRRVHVHRRTHIHRRTYRDPHAAGHALRAGLPALPSDPSEGVPNRDWGHHPDLFCGEALGAEPCDREEPERPPGHETNSVTIANFLYLPGDRSLGGQAGAPPRFKKGTALTFFNADQEAGIRHTVTTCVWPCNGRYVGNHPYPDGVWDSGTLGYDPVDGGNANPVASTPTTLSTGKYSYFCRIHPWMRGAFEVVD